MMKFILFTLLISLFAVIQAAQRGKDIMKQTVAIRLETDTKKINWLII